MLFTKGQVPENGRSKMTLNKVGNNVRSMYTKYMYTITNHAKNSPLTRAIWLRRFRVTC